MYMCLYIYIYIYYALGPNPQKSDLINIITLSCSE